MAHPANFINDLALALRHLETVEEVEQRSLAWFQCFGADRYTSAVYGGLSRKAYHPIASHDSTDWLPMYNSQRLYKHDCSLRLAATSFQFVAYETLEASLNGNISQDEQNFLYLSKQWGKLKSGFVFAKPRAAGVTVYNVSGEDVPSDLSWRVALLQALDIVVGFHQKVERKQMGIADDEDLSVSLTKQEVTVLRYVEEGLTNFQIAAQIKRKPVTVSFHLKNIYGKLRVSDRNQAVNIAQRLGLI